MAHRAWATQGGGAKLLPHQAALVVGDRPWLIRGELDATRLVRVSDTPGAVAEKAGSR